MLTTYYSFAFISKSGLFLSLSPKSTSYHHTFGHVTHLQTYHPPPFPPMMESKLDFKDISFFLWPANRSSSPFHFPLITSSPGPHVICVWLISFSHYYHKFSVGKTFVLDLSVLLPEIRTLLWIKSIYFVEWCVNDNFLRHCKILKHILNIWAL